MPPRARSPERRASGTRTGGPWSWTPGLPPSSRVVARHEARTGPAPPASVKTTYIGAHTVPVVGTPVRTFVGRGEERRRLEVLVAGAKNGEGGVLVLRGEAGIGKSALLDHLRRSAQGMRVIEATGSQFETELPFAALHQLCVPALGDLAALPPPHRAALEAAFGLADGTPEMFRIGMAALELLVTAAGSEPVLCLVDEAHWLDDASTRILTFLARRISAEPVAMVLAARHGLDELPSVEVTGLADDDARRLLVDTRATLDETVRDRVLAEARGNPLALLELPGAGGFALPDASSVPSRVERSFQDRLVPLPEDVRLLLTVASADPTGDPGLLWAAAERLGVGPAAGAHAEASGLVELGPRVRFCHPLARSAVYQAAAVEDRHAAHQALTEVTDPERDPDRRAWHRAQAGAGPDEDTAAELNRCATRAAARGGVAAAAAFLARAAALSRDPARRTERTLAAAQAHLDSGALDAADGLLTAVTVDGTDPVALARVELMRGRITFVRRRDGDGPAFMLRAAQRLAATDPRWSRDCFLDAVEMALVVGRASGVMDMVVEAARSAPPASGPPDLLDALLRLATEGHHAAARPVREILASRPQWTRRPALAGMLAVELWDAEAHGVITDWVLASARESGSPLTLRLGLGMAAAGAVHTGDFAAATSAIAEEEAVADAVGVEPLAYPQLHLAALRGREAQARAVIDSFTAEATASGTGQTIANADWATAVLSNGLTDYPAALAAAEAATRHGDLFVAAIALPELVEAAVRCGEHEVARSGSVSLTERTEGSGTPWALGVGAYTRALVTGDEDDFAAAIGHLEKSPLAPYLARAHLLYGEWLRRQGRRRDARRQLRTAYDRFADIGMAAFTDRAAAELRAAGADVRGRTSGNTDDLTAQETHIARLVADGATSKEVAARLFISPRTVDAHLRNIFRKLGITSRRQLRDLPALRTPTAR
ncbi:LuxR family transcriptional regulator [Frankia sp. CgS1]|uniref:AAA family ATPase n=1 Tax=Frankia TaxID=1854 RepID=UPI0009E99DB4